jgi:hypothetical protein
VVPSARALDRQRQQSGAQGSLPTKAIQPNRATTKMLCESALCLALQLDELPGGRTRSLLTASGLGDILVQRCATPT